MCSAEEQVYEDKDPGRLLLLCLWSSQPLSRPCYLLRPHGFWYDHLYQVSPTFQYYLVSSKISFDFFFILDCWIENFYFDYEI